MKSRLRDKFVPACYRPMIIDEWQHLRQGDDTMAEYIARFDELMIRCHLDKEPMATLARFRAGLRPEFQRELVLQEVSSLENAYRYTINMELFSSQAQRPMTPWIATVEVTQTVHSTHGNSLPFAFPLVSPSPAPPPPSRLYTPVTTPGPAITPATTTGGLLGPRTGAPTTKIGLPYPPANERSTDGRHPGGYVRGELLHPHPTWECGSRASSVKAGATLPPSVCPNDKQHDQLARCWRKFKTTTIHPHPAWTIRKPKFTKRTRRSLTLLKGRLDSWYASSRR